MKYEINSSLTKNIFPGDIPNQGFRVINRSEPVDQCVDCFNTRCRRPTAPKGECSKRVTLEEAQQ